jgi:hypothetical protein
MPDLSTASIRSRSLAILRSDNLVRSLPAALFIAVAWSLAWREGGSVDAADWLPYAIFCALLVVAVLASGQALRPSRAGLIGLAGLLCLAGWTAISLSWSPLPEAARNDALLVALYALVFLAALVAAGPGRTPATMLGVVVFGLVSLAFATEIKLIVDAHPNDLYASGRLFFPIGYWNAQAAMFLIGFWPAVVLAARRTTPVVLRALSCGGAASLLAGALLVQSKGGSIAVAVSAVVVLAVANDRLRILVVLLLTAVPVIASYLPLTRPYRLDSSGVTQAALDQGITSAASWALALGCGVAALGAVYALLDSRLEVSGKIRRACSVTAAVALVVAVVAGLSAAFVTIDHPISFAQSKWRAFTRMPTSAEGSSHLFSLGSNRYDFWRVAADDFADHPLAGIGQHGFAAAYLIEGRSNETPQRAHSVFFDQLSETGIVGFILLVVGIGAPLVLIARRARASPVHVGILGAAVYWLVHASGDWIWTFPSIGIPLFLMLGIGSAARSGRPLTARVGLPAAAAAAAIALFAFMPPWLSSRLTNDAVSASAAQARDDLRWARRLDPLAVYPFVVASAQARTPGESIAALRRAVDLEPRSVANWYLLGLEELKAGRRTQAKRHLLIARSLYPRDSIIADALKRTKGR